MVAESTHRNYLKNARSLERGFRRRGLPTGPEGYADEIARRASGLRGSTLRMYKRSAVYRLESIGDAAGADRLRALLEGLAFVTGKRRRLVRRVPDELVSALVGRLSDRGTAIALRTRDLVIATMVTGLRPGEWQQAELTDNILLVKNAKFKPELRGNGEWRELELLETVLGEERRSIERCIVAFKRSPYSAQRPNISVAFKEALSAAIRVTGASKWFYRLRVYDLRHQFSADAKASFGIGTGMVAAAMGHAVEETAIQHYGRAKYGKARSKVRPSDQSVAKVRRLYKGAPKPAVASPAPPPGAGRKNGPSP